MASIRGAGSLLWATVVASMACGAAPLREMEPDPTISTARYEAVGVQFVNISETAIYSDDRVKAEGSALKHLRNQGYRATGSRPEAKNPNPSFWYPAREISNAKAIEMFGALPVQGVLVVTLAQYRRYDPGSTSDRLVNPTTGAVTVMPTGNTSAMGMSVEMRLVDRATGKTAWAQRVVGATLDDAVQKGLAKFPAR